MTTFGALKYLAGKDVARGGMLVTKPQPSSSGGRFRGFLLAQAKVLVALLIVAAVFAPPEALLAMAWGGVISLLSAAWAGFQLWLHPRNADPVRGATAAIRAEVGRVVIVLVCLWQTLRHWSEVREAVLAGMLLAGVFLVQWAGWIWLARHPGEEGAPPQRHHQD